MYYSKLYKLAKKEYKGTVKTMIKDSKMRIQWTISKYLNRFIEDTYKRGYKDKMNQTQFREFLIRCGLEYIWNKEEEKNGKAEN